MYINYSGMKSIVFACFVMMTTCFGRTQDSLPLSWTELALPDTNGQWLQPPQRIPARPVWGHANGIQVGLSPLPGPRGLLRIYTPYLGHNEVKMINFIAFEPIVEGETRRGFSELEISALDSVRGKRFWSADDSSCTDALSAVFPARGIVEKINGIETLTVFIFSETFNNGAKVYTRLRFYEDRPFELELTSYACMSSKKLDYFILTATMGNFARLRTLFLEDSIKSSLELWPDYTDIHFAPHDYTRKDEMITDNKGGVYFIAAPNEENPLDVEYAPGTNEHWKYYGKVAAQYWYCPDPHEKLYGLVNGRYVYWAGTSIIPGGISFENFELLEPFRNGGRYVFGVTPLCAEAFINKCH